jgi:release factor glutamine methyltransferase
VKSRELIEISIKRLSEAGIDNSRFIVFLLSKEILSLTEVDLLLDTQREIESSLTVEFFSAVKRVAKGEPIDYVLGYKDFFGNRPRAFPCVLIPRSETEELVEIVIEEEKDSKVFADIGTGKWSDSLRSCAKSSLSTVFATDISTEAIALAEAECQK